MKRTLHVCALLPFLGLAACSDTGDDLAWDVDSEGDAFVGGCDGDGDSLVSFDEFGECDSHNINPIEFDGVDASGDGYVNSQEYQDYIHGRN